MKLKASKTKEAEDARTEINAKLGPSFDEAESLKKSKDGWMDMSGQRPNMEEAEGLKKSEDARMEMLKRKLKAELKDAGMEVPRQ